MVKQPAWCADDDVCATLQGRYLCVDGLPAVAGYHPQLLELTELGNLIAYLDGKFAGWSQHKTLYALLVHIDALNHGYTEGACLAGARHCLSHHIRSGQHRGDALFLYGRGVLVAHALEGAGYVIADVEGAEVVLAVCRRFNLRSSLRWLLAGRSLLWGYPRTGFRRGNIPCLIPGRISRTLGASWSWWSLGSGGVLLIWPL